MGDSHHKCITHAEGTLPIGHSGVCPTTRKALQLIKLIGDEPAQTSIRTLNNVLEAGSAASTLAGENGARRSIDSIGEGHRSL